MIRYIVVKSEDPLTLCSFNKSGTVELFPTVYTALSFIDEMIKDECKYMYEVREFNLCGNIGRSFGGVV
ncbi:hypothetical protein CPT_Privateer_053 [Proteus phage Privateer]|uniref:Uncharacterized protein n=1 Tax=Proteus phage Privateer TaxID=2712958 RepID=A0A6G8R3V4_9CAUD|nr:hypothetical protein HWD17_gp053 [Proteus phage Privateer]QIN94846.1 hypothetical protein CPT_Privateer_053 [Proteus phage Privateer]